MSSHIHMTAITQGFPAEYVCVYVYVYAPLYSSLNSHRSPQSKVIIYFMCLLPLMELWYCQLRHEGTIIISHLTKYSTSSSCRFHLYSIRKIQCLLYREMSNMWSSHLSFLVSLEHLIIMLLPVCIWCFNLSKFSHISLLARSLQLLLFAACTHLKTLVLAYRKVK